MRGPTHITETDARTSTPWPRAMWQAHVNLIRSTRQQCGAYTPPLWYPMKPSLAHLTIPNITQHYTEPHIRNLRPNCEKAWASTDPTEHRLPNINVPWPLIWESLCTPISDATEENTGANSSTEASSSTSTTDSATRPKQSSAGSCTDLTHIESQHQSPHSTV